MTGEFWELKSARLQPVKFKNPWPTLSANLGTVTKQGLPERKQNLCRSRCGQQEEVAPSSKNVSVDLQAKLLAAPANALAWPALPGPTHPNTTAIAHSPPIGFPSQRSDPFSAPKVALPVRALLPLMGRPAVLCRGDVSETG